MTKKRLIRVADTTLRDGAQTIGAHFSLDSKLRIAQQLVRLGVDFLEVGCPVASPQELEVAKKISELLKNDPVDLAVFARCIDRDIEIAWEGVKNHPRSTLALLTSVSDIHINAKFKASREEISKSFCEKIELARKMGFNKIMVYLEDGTRTDFSHLAKLVSSFAKSGADIISIPDTVGFVNCPEKYGEIFSRLINEVKLPENLILSSHTHNDKGLAVANALSALQHGAHQVEGTINGLGERSGNVSLGSLLINLNAPHTGSWASVDYPFKTNIKLDEYAKTAQMVGDLSGMGINYNEPLMGSAVHTTAAGIHQDGVLKDKETYSCIDSKAFGFSSEGKLITFNMQSGQKGITKVLSDIGIETDKETLKKIYEQVILLAQHKTPSLEDIRAIAMDISEVGEAIVELAHCKTYGGVTPCSTEVVLIKKDEEQTLRGIGYGDGPFAAFMDITCHLLKLKANILDYHDVVVGEGRHAQMQSFIRCSIDGLSYQGRGVSTDIVLAGCRAFLKCINAHLSKNSLDH